MSLGVLAPWTHHCYCLSSVFTVVSVQLGLTSKDNSPHVHTSVPLIQSGTLASECNRSIFPVRIKSSRISTSTAFARRCQTGPNSLRPARPADAGIRRSPNGGVLKAFQSNWWFPGCSRGHAAQPHGPVGLGHRIPCKKTKNQKNLARFVCVETTGGGVARQPIYF